MREKRLWFLLFSAILVVFFVYPAFAVSPPDCNWGDVNGTVDVVPLELLGESYYSWNGAETELEFTADGYFGEFVYASPDNFLIGDTFDALIIRTTSVSGDLDGTAWYMYGDAPVKFTFAKDAEVSGDFDFISSVPGEGLWINESCDVAFKWDFTLEEGRIMSATLHARDNNDEYAILYGDTASCDVGVVLLEEIPTFDILVGDTSMEHPLFSKTVDSLDQDIDLGPVFFDPSDKISIVFANFWNQQIALESGQNIFPVNTYFAPSLDDSEGPAVVNVSDPYSIDPALAYQIMLYDIGSETLQDCSFDIEFTDGSVTHLSWLWCEPAGEVDASAVGVVHNPPASADVNVALDPDVMKVLGPDDFSASPTSSDFNISSMPVEAMYMGQVSMDVEVPTEFSGQPVALPVGLRIALELTDEHNALETYDPELAQAIDAELGEDPTEEEMVAVIRKYISFEKEWSTGETAEIKLGDDKYKDAVRIFFEYEEGDVVGVYFTANLLIVNGGTAGVVDSVIVDGKTYIVIYDGTLDDRFVDPIKIVAATEPPVGDDDDDDSVSVTSDGSGCSALGFAPAAGLLLMPLLLLLKK